MDFNIISIVSFAIMILLNLILKRFKYTPIILQIFSIILFVYKSYHYIIQNIQGNFLIPVEISSISYFLIPIILTFKIKKLYKVASFFGIAAGLGFYLFYCVFGFAVRANFEVTDLLISIFSHSYLLTAGLQLMFTEKFENQPKTIWITILAMLCWAMAFYDFNMRGITFVYYIVKPTYLCIFSSNTLNFLLIVLFYAVVVTIFALVVKLFFVVNNKLHPLETHQKEKVQSVKIAQKV